MSSRLGNAFFRGFALAAIALCFVPAACDNGVTETGSTASATITNGTGFNPPCNDNHQDGYCNAHGATPESCECLDCSDTAYCKNGCVDDGQCNANAGEDCTCTDCFGSNIDGEECPFSMSGPGPTSSPQSSSAAGGGMGSTSSVASTAQATTVAATTAMSSAAGTGGMSSSSSN